jgi:hypothetical protein
MPEPVYRFAEALRRLLGARTPGGLELAWGESEPDTLGWEALARAWKRDVRSWEPALDEVDGLLLRLLDRLPVLAAGTDSDAVHVRTFRVPELERLQHATAAALVAQRFGAAGLRAVVADQDAPVARRYFAFHALAERHRRSDWPLFERYLTPDAHHAFVGTAAEAARFYPGNQPTQLLIELFTTVREDIHLREFLSPRILESLFVLGGGAETLKFFRGLLTAGYTHHHPTHCEVTRALVMVRRLTGRLEENAKYADTAAPEVQAALDQAEEMFEEEREVLTPVVVI